MPACGTMLYSAVAATRWVRDLPTPGGPWQDTTSGDLVWGFCR